MEVQHHPLFATHPSALQILFYFDDVEVCNPLGSKTKTHKLSFFYFNLGNLKDQSYQGYNFCKHKLVSEYGMDAVLLTTHG